MVPLKVERYHRLAALGAIDAGLAAHRGLGDPEGGAQLAGGAVQLTGSSATAGFWHGTRGGGGGWGAGNQGPVGMYEGQAKYGDGACGTLPLGPRSPPRHRGAPAGRA